MLDVVVFHEMAAHQKQNPNTKQLVLRAEVFDASINGVLPSMSHAKRWRLCKVATIVKPPHEEVLGRQTGFESGTARPRPLPAF
jgi:hypothetical protein